MELMEFASDIFALIIVGCLALCVAFVKRMIVGERTTKVTHNYYHDKE